MLPRERVKSMSICVDNAARLCRQNLKVSNQSGPDRSIRKRPTPPHPVSSFYGTKDRWTSEEYDRRVRCNSKPASAKRRPTVPTDAGGGCK